MGKLALYVAQLTRVARELATGRKSSPSSGTVNALASTSGGAYRASQCASDTEQVAPASPASSAFASASTDSPTPLISSACRSDGPSSGYHIAVVVVVVIAIVDFEIKRERKPSNER